MEFLLAAQGAVAQGSLWAILALGTYITFRLLNFPDMTVDGSFASGACVGAILIVSGAPVSLALLCAFLTGAAAGAITGFLHNTLGIPEILAGILTQIGLYSINLRILGRANQPLLREETLFKKLKGLLGSMGLNASSDMVGWMVGLVLILLVISALYWFFGTEIGAAIRATGNNGAMVRALGQDTRVTKFVALVLSNALIGFAGCMVAMYQGSADVGMGAGAIVIGLASIVIGEVLFPKARSFYAKMAAVATGSILYRLIVALVLQLGLNTNDMKLLTAILVAVALYLPKASQARRERRAAQSVKEEGDA